MTVSDQLNSLINDAYRNGKDETCAALKLLRDPVAKLEAEIAQHHSPECNLTDPATGETLPELNWSLIGELQEEIQKYRNRLQFDPSGCDKIDELESCIGNLRHEIEQQKSRIAELETDLGFARARELIRKNQ